MGNGAGGAGTFITVTLTPRPDLPGRHPVAERRHVHLRLVQADRQLRRHQPGEGRHCVDPIIGYNAGACAGNPCDLTLTGEHTTPFPSITSGTDLGDPYVSGGVTYSRSGPVTANFTDLCGKTSPYAGAGASCNLVFGGCSIAQTNGPYDIFTAGISNYYDASYTPPGSWQLVNTASSTVDVLINTVGSNCPALGTVVTSSSGPPEWQSAPPPAAPARARQSAPPAAAVRPG